MSVKSSSKGLRKRDPMSQPVATSEDLSMLFLQNSIRVFEEGKSSQSSRLTSETFIACLQSMKALPLWAEHLLENTTLIMC